mmetsp:Transcript_24836/g.51964  ORF Transcript_24836/g.51964 Transcript_24836/m.51964 type:complete len:262 (+) Transcript_24836:528-1313(+)
MGVSRTASTTAPVASRSICTAAMFESVALPLTERTWSPSWISGHEAAMPDLSSTLITGSTSGCSPAARGVASLDTSPSSDGVLWWKMMPNRVVTLCLYSRTSRTPSPLIEPRGVTPSSRWISSTRCASASESDASCARESENWSLLLISCSCRFSLATRAASAVTCWFSRTSVSMDASLSCCLAEYSPICSMYSCILAGLHMSFSLGMRGGGDSASALRIASSILSAVRSCRSESSRSRSSRPSISPLTSMSSFTAAWNFP